MAIWWDGDLLRELLDGTTIQKYRGKRLLSASGSTGSRNAPMGYGDIFGDWREEVWYIAGNRELRIYTTTIPSDRRFVTFMHDKDYRISVACEMVGYMQATQPGFYFGVDMDQATEDTPPFEPLELKGFAGQDSVLLVWKANLEQDIAGYNIHRSDTKGGPYTKVNAILVPDPEYVDRTVTNELTYYYVVSAVDIDGNESRYSAEIDAFPTSIPVNPAGLSAGIDVDIVQLFWRPNPEKDIAGYFVYRSEAVDGEFIKSSANPIADTSFTDTNVTKGKAYYYKISAIDEQANESPHSKLFTAIPDIPIVLQAEDAMLINGCRFRNHASGYNGSGFVDFVDATGELLFDHVNGREGGDHKLLIRYAQRTAEQTLIGFLRINGTRKVLRTYDTGSLKVWRVDTLIIPLNSGMNNTLLFMSPRGDLCNLDEITIQPLDYTSVLEQESALPAEYTLYQNYPNPFNGTTKIEYDLKQDCHVTLEIYNSLGQIIAKLVDEKQAAGKHVTWWRGRDEFGRFMPTGVNVYKIETSTGFKSMRKMLYIK
jgi:rhamnogalacturonan endolyase